MAAAALIAGCGGRKPVGFAGFVDVPVAALAAQASGRLDQLLVREGERVRAGQLLARLDARDRAASVEVARANVDRAEQALAEAEQNARATVPTERGAAAEIARAEAELFDARRNYERTRELLAGGAATAAQRDSAWARVEAARAAVAAQRASRSSTRGRVGASFAAVENARAALASSRASLALAEAQLAQTEVIAPFDGLLVDENLRAGEWAAPGTPVLTVEDWSRQWVRIDLPETALGGLRVGRAAEVRVASQPKRTFRGSVIEIGAEGEFALNRDVKRGRPDVRTFRVRVGIEPPAPELRPGMTADVSFP